MPYIYTVTVSCCIACGKCELACAFAHGWDGIPGESRIRIYKRGVEQGTPINCYQCEDAACMAACPVDALVRSEETGAVEVLYERCINCRMCVAACPFGNMHWDPRFQMVHKCDLCEGEPQCVPFCPTKAIDYVYIEEEKAINE